MVLSMKKSLVHGIAVLLAASSAVAPAYVSAKPKLPSGCSWESATLGSTQLVGVCYFEDAIYWFDANGNYWRFDYFIPDEEPTVS